MTTNLVHIPFHGTEILAVDVDGKPHVILKPFVEALGLAYQPQHRKLRGKSWASVTTTVMQVPGDTQSREHTTADVRTALMLLATIDERRVAEGKRELLIAYQSEVADVIESYWTEGGAINPRASEDQLAGIVSLAERQMSVLAAAKGLLSADWLATKAKLVASRALGEAPEIDSDELPMYVDDFLAEKRLSKPQIAALRSPFGRRLSQAHYEAHGFRPDKVPAEVNGRPRQVNLYHGRDRHLFEQVWQAHFAEAFNDLFVH